MSDEIAFELILMDMGYSEMGAVSNAISLRNGVSSQRNVMKRIDHTAVHSYIRGEWSDEYRCV